MAGYFGFDANISFTFQAFKKNLTTHAYVLGCFVHFLVIFGYILISKIYENRKFGRFGIVLNLESEVKNWRGAILGSVNCLVVSHNLFSPFNPSLNPL